MRNQQQLDLLRQGLAKQRTKKGRACRRTRMHHLLHEMFSSGKEKGSVRGCC